MVSLKLSIISNKIASKQAFSKLEPILDELGTPLALTEIDEDQDIYELSIYTDKSQQELLENLITDLTNYKITDIIIEELPDIDWVAASLSQLKPIETKRFVIHGAHDRSNIDPSLISIEIEAGLAFGTGHHATTVACLELLEQQLEQLPKNLLGDLKMLDLGTGSGILAIAMAKLGGKHIIASDIDEVAIKVCNENIEFNQVADFISTYTACGFSEEQLIAAAPFDFVVANILANPLVELAGDIYKYTKPNATIILSGLLASQADWVIEAYLKHGFSHKTSIIKEDWAAISLQR